MSDFARRARYAAREVCLTIAAAPRFLVYNFEDLIQAPMREPRVVAVEEGPPQPILSERANTGIDAAILVSGSYDIYDANRFIRYLKDRRVFFGLPVATINFVTNAREDDLEAAIKDPNVSSIAVFGHSSVGSWESANVDVTYHDVARWVEQAGHYKNGFGLKTGCNGILNAEKRKKFGLPDDVDKRQLLAPAFPYNNYKVKGFPYSGEPGSEGTLGMGKNPRLVKIVSEGISRS